MSDAMKKDDGVSGMEEKVSHSEYGLRATGTPKFVRKCFGEKEGATLTNFTKGSGVITEKPENMTRVTRAS